MYNLELWQYVLLILSAFFLGLGKGGLPGVGNLTVVLAALVLPAKASVALDSAKREIERQIASIEAGEQAANAKLQAAIDTLQPAVDYHEYSRGGTR